MWVIQEGDDFNLVSNFLILGFVVTACFCLWAILGWHICDTAQWPGLGSSLKTNFVLDFLLLFSSGLFFSQCGSLIWLIVRQGKHLPADCVGVGRITRWNWVAGDGEGLMTSLLRTVAECWTTAWRYVCEAGAMDHVSCKLVNSGIASSVVVAP